MKKILLNNTLTSAQNGAQSYSRRVGKTRTLGVLAAAALFLLPACGPQANTTVAEEENVTADEVADNTGDHIGEEVTIRSTVEKTVDDSAFLLNDDDYFNGDGILVINASGEPFVVPDVGDSEVQVTGKVQTFVMATAAKDYGVELSPELYEDYETKPVIVAQSIALAPDPGDITADPEKFYNQRIAVEGEVEDIRQNGLFTMDEERLFGGEDLLVYAPGQSREVKDGEQVTVTGVLRPFIKADFERDYNLQWDLDVATRVEAEYETKPVFVADNVYPSAI